MSSSFKKGKKFSFVPQNKNIKFVCSSLNYKKWQKID